MDWTVAGSHVIGYVLPGVISVHELRRRARGFTELLKRNREGEKDNL